MRIAEVGFDPEGMELVMESELGAVVEGDGASEFFRQLGKELMEFPGDRLCPFVRSFARQEEARLSFVDDESGLAVSGKEDEIAFPMAIGFAAGSLVWPPRYRNTCFDEENGTVGSFAAPAPLAFGAGEEEAPAIVLGTSDLSVEEAVDGFVADDGSAMFFGEAACDLLGRPAFSQAHEDGASELVVSFEAGSFPASSPSLLVSVAGLISDELSGITLYLASDRRCLAIQSCRDFPYGAALGTKAGNLAAFVQ
jgi:hypothetical protein